jgi:hypothetical protein
MSKRFKRLVLTLALLSATPIWSQQDYVGLFDVYSGFAWLDSPSANLAERGYHLQAGISARTWLSLGFDFTTVHGNVTLVPNLLKPSLQTQIGQQLAALEAAGVVPPGYQVAVGTQSDTQTFAGGPQWEYRHFRSITFFAHPSIGAIHETATPHPSDTLTAGIVHQLAPSGKLNDWEPFYGLGGGLEVNFVRHASLRIQADYVHNNLFTDILKGPRNTVRLSVGPAVHFGRNIVR